MNGATYEDGLEAGIRESQSLLERHAEQCRLTIRAFRSHIRDCAAELKESGKSLTPEARAALERIEVRLHMLACKEVG